MEEYIGGRGNGKTLKAIQISAKEQLPIVVFNEHHKSNVLSLAKKLELNIPEPIVWHRVKEKCVGNHKELIVDDLDYLLRQIFNGEKIKYFTTTEDISTKHLKKEGLINE